MIWLAAIPARIKKGVLWALAAIATLSTAAGMVRRDERQEIERRAAEARIKHTKDAEEIEDEVADMDEPERRSRLGDMFQSDD